MDSQLTLSHVILDSLSDGVYVCDRNRKIVYWSKSAERITGWTSRCSMRTPRRAIRN